MPTERTHNYAAKNGVRNEWIRFLGDAGVLGDPHDASGFYLPGIENIELELYRRLGIDPRRLVGAEHLVHLAPLVRERDVMTLVQGSISKAVEAVIAQQLHPLTFAHVDLDGSYHTFLEDFLSLFRVFPTRTGGCLCVTSYSARDDETVMQGVVNTSKFYSVAGNMGQFWKDYGRMLERHTALRRMLVDSRSEDHAHLSRELGFLWWIALVMGTVEESVQDGRLSVVHRSYIDTLEGPLRSLTEHVQSISTNARDFRLVHEPALRDLVSKTRCPLWPDRFEHYAYHTTGHQPMRTWMIRLIHVPEGMEPPTHLEIIEQLWNMAVRTPLVFYNESGVRVSFD